MQNWSSKFCDADLAERFLVDDRDFGPFLRIVEAAGVDAVELARGRILARFAFSTAIAFRARCISAISCRDSGS